MSSDEIDNQVSEIMRDSEEEDWVSFYSTSSEEEDVEEAPIRLSEANEVEEVLICTPEKDVLGHVFISFPKEDEAGEASTRLTGVNKDEGVSTCISKENEVDEAAITLTEANKISEASTCSPKGNEVEGSSTSSLVEDELKKASTSSSEEDEWKPTGSFQSFPFSNEESLNIGSAKTPIDFFKLLFNTSFMIRLVVSINNHALQVQEKLHSESQISNWTNTNMEELYIFLGLLLHMGHIKLHNINDYWITSAVYDMPFKKFMCHDRFLLILKNFRFSDFSKSLNRSDPNKYTKPIIDFFNNTMKTLVKPSKILTIDESVVSEHSNLKIKQTIQREKHTYAVKLYALTGSDGITQNIQMYCKPHDVNLRVQGDDDKVIMMLMKDYLNLGHSLYTNISFNSVALAEDLLAKKTYLTGTLRINKLRNPDITKAKLAKNEAESRFNTSGVCVTNYRSKKTLLMISTEHNAEFVQDKNYRNESVAKPKVVCEYNKYIKSLDIKNQRLSEYSCNSDFAAWHNKIIFHIMDIMVLNAFLMFKSQQSQATSEDINYYDFRLNVVEALVNSNKKTNNQNSNSRGRQSPSGLTFIHWPEHLPKNEKRDTKSQYCRYCLVKNNEKKAATFFCPHCDGKPRLHLTCFKEYHGY